MCRGVVGVEFDRLRQQVAGMHECRLIQPVDGLDCCQNALMSRRYLGSVRRFGCRAAQEKLGIDYSTTSDTEILDSIQYFIFPNFFLFGGKGFPLGYRVLPVPGDHESCTFEVIAMLEMPEGVPLPKDVPLVMTPTDEPWEALQDSFGKGVAVFDQDQANLVKFQSGLRQNGIKQIHLANYQERNIRNFLLSLEKHIAAGQVARPAASAAQERAPQHA